MDHTLYGPKFFARRASLAWRAPVVAGAIMYALNGEIICDAVDFGCGNGDIVNSLRMYGVQPYGIEGSECAREYSVLRPGEMLIHNLCEPLPNGLFKGQIDLGICLEVAEHLPEVGGLNLLDSLTSNCDILLFGAALPGQGGIGHITLRTAGWWAHRLDIRGFLPQPDMTQRFKYYLAPCAGKKGIKAYYHNAAFYRRRG